MNSLSYSPRAPIDPRVVPNHMASVAFSVAESALEPGPDSPTYPRSMSQMMNTVPVDVPCDGADIATFPRLRHKSSFAGRPLWDVVEHAKERREKKANLPVRPMKPASFSQDMTIDSIFGGGAAAGDDFYQEILVTPEDSVVEPALAHMEEVQNALSRLSTVDGAHAPARRQSDVTGGRPSQVLRSQANHRPLTRLPSLAEIKAKMTTSRGGASSPDFARRPNGRSDSLDSNDSEGPQTPTDEWNSFDFRIAGAPATPETPSTSRLAPFLRERTNGRLARPNSMPPLSSAAGFANVCPPSPESPKHSPQSSPGRSARQQSLPGSLPGTPQSLRRRLNSRMWTADGVIAHRRSNSSSPASPTESEHSSISSNFSLPIITCTPADEEDSDEESEGDVIVFCGDLEEQDDPVEELEDLEEERREREFLGREMLFRLSRRSSDTSTIRPSVQGF